MKKIIVLFVGIFSIAILVSACKESKKEAEKSELHEHESQKHEHDAMANAAVFQCPMDCEKGKTYGEKGNCPVCKMDLKSKEGEHEEGKHEDEVEEHGESEELDDDK